ncbi:hypothetical protein [Blautia sp. HCP28S3_G10]|uniref:hypothetical protein n=1 Tax=Blautia sp. HCP28S3_G10 TaxID=3438908 RepID=UPI003F8B390E
MDFLTLDEEKLLVWFGCENLEFTKRRLKMVGLFATDEDFRKLVFGLLRKLNTEEYASIYTDMFFDICAENDARNAARDQYLAVLSDTTGHEAEYLLRI